MQNLQVRFHLAIAKQISIAIFLLVFIRPAYSQLDIEVTEALIKRVVPEHHDQFKVEPLSDNPGGDIFEIESRDDKIILRGTDGVSIASALHHYLKEFCNVYISWNDFNPELPSELPRLKKKIRKDSPYKYRYYLNYVTFSYSMVWWDWERWQKEIDWMALHGMNMPLALTGQNAVWQKVYQSFGFDEDDLKDFFSGPAYLAWNWLGVLDGWGGPLPQSWIESQKDLQKKILKRERGLGMTPVLPAFNGHVPPAFQDKFPDAEINNITWMGFPETNMLDPNDPMFTKIGKKFIEEQNKMYGTDHLYSADAFIEVTPPSDDTTYIRNMANTMYESMSQADPEATWVMQGWMFHYVSDFWELPQIEAFMDGVPDEGLIVLDLYSENNPVWNRAEAFFGKPWIWNMLHNFGGTNSLDGRMDIVANHPAKALNNPESGNMVGIGLTMEGIEHNPALYALMTKNIWRDRPIDVDEWIVDYTVNRYGKRNDFAVKAWQNLKNSVYDVGVAFGGPQSIITGRPTLRKSQRYTRTTLEYDPKDLVRAWEYLMKATPKLKDNEGFKYDLVDVTRQVLANYANVIQQEYVQAIDKDQIKKSESYSHQFLALIDDLDTLLSTREEFLFGKWLKDAKALSTNEQEARLYEKNAKNLLTTWGDKDSYLRDYAARQWAGLFKGFYKPRWEQFFKYAAQRSKNDKEIDVEEIREEIKNWEWEWINKNESYPVEPKGDPVKVVKKMFEKYHDDIVDAYRDNE